MEPESVKKTSRLAKSALTCVLLAGICLLLYFLAPLRCWTPLIMLLFIVGLLLGVISLFVIAIRRRCSRGWGYAILAIVLALPANCFFYGAHNVVRNRAERAKVLKAYPNLALLGKALFAYAEDNGGYLPDANQWCDLLLSCNRRVTKESFRHPQHRELNLGICNFAFNKNLSGVHLSEIAENTVVLFEADGDWNLNGGPELLESRYTKYGYIAMLFADQTIESYWFYKKAVGHLSGEGMDMFYEPPRWNP